MSPYAHPPFEAPDPLRTHILAGHPLIALADETLEGRIVEAARIAGRLGDLRVVASDGERRQPFLDGGAVTFRVPWRAVRGGPGDPDVDDAEVAHKLAFRDLPPIAAPAIDWSRAILVFRGPREPTAERAFGLAVGTAVAAAKLAGGAAPAWFIPAERPRWDYGRAVAGLAESATARFGTGVLDYVTNVDPGLPPADWPAALAAFRKGRLQAHDDVGLHIVIDGNRLAAAHAVADIRMESRRRIPGDEPVPGVRVYEIQDGGIPSLLQIPGIPVAGNALAVLAMETFKGGITHTKTLPLGELMSGEPDKSLEMPFTMGLWDLQETEGRRQGPGDETLRGVLERRLDVPLIRSVSGTTHVRTLLRTVGEDPALSGPRRDFCGTWEGLSPTLLEPSVRTAVDAGERTLPVVARLLDVPEAIARRLVGRRIMPALMGWDAIHGPGEGSKGRANRTYPPSTLFRAFGHDRLPLPGDRTEWSGFLAVSSAMSAILSRAQVQTPRVPIGTVAALMLGGGTSWAARREAIKAAAPTTQDLGDIGDMVMALARWLTAIRGARVPNDLAFALLAGHGSLPRLHAASVRWHALPELASLAPGDRTARWPVPFEPADLGGGWRALALADARALRSEGAHGPDPDGLDGLGHCVGGYASRCVTGESLVVSLRRTDGEATKRVSTAELAPHERGQLSIGGIPYRLVQHRGRGNAPPSPEAEACLLRLLDGLGSGRIPTDPEALRPRPERRGSWIDRTQALPLHDAWRRILPRGLRPLPADDLVARLAEMDRDLPPPRDLDAERALMAQALRHPGLRPGDLATEALRAALF